MPEPRVVAVAPRSPAARAGLRAGDTLASLNGVRPRDVLEYHQLASCREVDVEVDRDGERVPVTLRRQGGEPLGMEVESALFDQVRTCDNHCDFCFIYQLPPGLRESLYLKDDDFRLSFLYGNFTTLTRFTEADLERVVAEGLSPLNVSIHATDPLIRADMLKNVRGATSLRWLGALLDHGVTVNGQVVVCPGVNDGAVLEDTLAGVLDQYPALASLCIVPLGLSRYNSQARLRPLTAAEAGQVLDTVDKWQLVFTDVLGRRLVHAADELYIAAGRPFPPAAAYEGFPMHEDGVGMARTFELELTGKAQAATGPAAGFFAWVDGAPAAGYRAERSPLSAPAATDGPVDVLTGELGAHVLAPLLAGADFEQVEVVPVDNRFFGGNIGVTGLLVGEDVDRVLAGRPAGRRPLLPDVCLSQGRFLDGTTPEELCRSVEVVATDGFALRAALGLG